MQEEKEEEEACNYNVSLMSCTGSVAALETAQVAFMN